MVTARWFRPVVTAVAALAAVATPILPAAQASAATSGYRLTRTALPDGSRMVVRWNPCKAIEYRINVAALPADQRSGAATQIRSAVRRLASASGLRFSYLGRTRQVPQSRPPTTPAASLVIAVTTRSRTDLAIGGSTIGVGGTSWVTWTTRTGSTTRYGTAVRHGFVAMDRTALSRLTPGFGRGPTQGNALLHELGHAVGLRHAGDSRQVMYPMLSRATPRGFGDGDRAGLARVGRAAGCIAIPAGLD